MNKKILIFFIILFCLLSVSTTHAKEKTQSAVIPSFSLKNLKGEKIQISEFKGEVVVISFWATWCGPCKRELDDLKYLHNKEGKNFKVLAIATDGPETYSNIRGVVKRHKWPFHVLPDKQGEITSILNPRGTIPYSIYVDRQGHIAYDHEGYSQGAREKMFKRIKNLLKGGK